MAPLRAEASASSSGNIEPFEVAKLAAHSNSVTQPTLFHYINQRKDLARMAASVFDAVVRGALAVAPGTILPLTAAAVAHTELESSQASGPLPLAS